MEPGAPGLTSEDLTSERIQEIPNDPGTPIAGCQEGAAELLQTFTLRTEVQPSQATMDSRL